MTLAEAKQLCTLLYYTATGTHAVDDRQWAVLLDVMNKKYWNEISRAIGSIYALDTPDLTTDGYGQLDYSGSSVVGNDINQRSVTSFTTGNWTLSGVTTREAAAISPNGIKDAWEISSDASAGQHIVSLSSFEPGYQAGLGVFTIYAKAGTAQYLYINNNTANIQFYDLLNGRLGSVTGAPGLCSISPVSQPGFGAYVSPVTGGATNISSTGWYKCVYRCPVAGDFSAGITVGIAITDGTLSFTSSGKDVYVYAPRRAFIDDMIDPAGVHMPLAVELKFFGRYVKLDYEIPQDRYIYNIAFGQVQVLIPSAWTVLGEKITLLPRVSGAQTIRVSYIPRLADLTNDDQQLLMGRLPTYHPLIAYEVVMSMMPNGTERANVVAPLGELRAQLKNYLQSRQRQDGRKIRFVPYE